MFQEYIATPHQLLELTDADLRSFHTATNCHICNQPLGGDKVRDHCQIVGSYRGAAHSSCNLAYRISKSERKLPVVMHNLKGYDGHVIAKALKSEFGEVRVILQNMRSISPSLWTDSSSSTLSNSPLRAWTVWCRPSKLMSSNTCGRLFPSNMNLIS